MQNSFLISRDSEDKNQLTYNLQNTFYQYIYMYVNPSSLLFALSCQTQGIRLGSNVDKESFK